MIKKIYHSILNNVKQEKIKKLLEINNYLNSYDYNSDYLSNTPLENNENYIWQLWFQGENNAPHIVKQCVESIKNFHPEKKIVVVDETSIDNYLEIPQFIKDKYKQKIISKAHYSDYIRTCLLAKYGGIWIDATVLLTDKIPDEILNQDFYVFKNPIWFEYKKVPSENLFKVFLSIDAEAGFYGSNWFIVSKSNNLIMKLQKQLLEEYWRKEDTLMHYFMYHFIFSKLLINNNECREIFEKMLSGSNKAPHYLQNVFNRKSCSLEFETIKKTTSIHKLTYKFDKVIPNSFLDRILKNYKENQ